MDKAGEAALSLILIYNLSCGFVLHGFIIKQNKDQTYPVLWGQKSEAATNINQPLIHVNFCLSLISVVVKCKVSACSDIKGTLLLI